MFSLSIGENQGSLLPKVTQRVAWAPRPPTPLPVLCPPAEVSQGPRVGSSPRSSLRPPWRPSWYAVGISLCEVIHQSGGGASLALGPQEQRVLSWQSWKERERGFPGEGGVYLDRSFTYKVIIDMFRFRFTILYLSFVFYPCFSFLCFLFPNFFWDIWTFLVFYFHLSVVFQLYLSVLLVLFYLIFLFVYLSDCTGDYNKRS